MAVTRDQAIAELARRELARRAEQVPESGTAEAYAGLDIGQQTPEGVAKEAARATQGERIGRDRPLKETLATLMKEGGMDYGDRADALLGSGPVSLLHGTSQLLEDSPASKLYRQLTNKTKAEASAENIKGIEEQRALGAAASMDEGRGLINAGTMGRIASDVATLALPMGAAEKAAGVIAGRALPQSAAKITGASGVGAIEGAAQPVLPGESRALNTGIGAALPGAASAVGQAGRRAGTGMFDTNPAAARLEQDTNITPTLGQAAEGGIFAKLIKNIEDYTEGLLPGVKGGRKRARQELFDTIGMDASPKGLSSIDNPHRVGSPEYFNTMRDQYDDAYGKLLNDVELEAPGIRQLVDDALESAGTEFDDKLRKRLKTALLEGFPEEGVAMVDGRKIKSMMSAASEGINKAIMGGDPGVNRSAIAMYNAVRDNLNELLAKRIGPEKALSLKSLDDAYAHRQVLEETAANVFPTTPGELTPEALSQAVAGRSTSGMLANQTGTAAELAADAATTMRPARESMWARTLGGLGLAGGAMTSPALTAGVALPLAGITAIGATKRGSEFFRGQLGKQKEIARVMREIVEPKIGTASVLLTDREE